MDGPMEGNRVHCDRNSFGGKIMHLATIGNHLLQ